MLSPSGKMCNRESVQVDINRKDNSLSILKQSHKYRNVSVLCREFHSLPCQTLLQQQQQQKLYSVLRWKITRGLY